jgi:hypothetical protein
MTDLFGRGRNEGGSFYDFADSPRTFTLGAVLFEI